MKEKLIKIFAILLISTVNASSFGSYSGSFLRMGTSARAIAMGNGFTSELDNGFTAYHNPASLPFSLKRQIGFSNHFLPLDRRLMAASFSTPLPPTASLGIGWISAGVDKIDGRNSSGKHTQYLSTSENAFVISFAQRFFPWLSIGMNLKILQHQLPINSTDLAGKGIGVDFGIRMNTKSGVKLALMVQDLNSRYQWKTDKIYERGKVYIDQFPTIIRLGTNFDYKNFHIVGDFGALSNQGQILGYSLRFGGEYKYLNNYYIRAGLGNRRMSVGVGLDWSLLREKDGRLDYAFVYENPAGAAHIFTYAFTF